ncbi:hypothetical protein [Paenarthrobacter sp. CAP02]
MNENIPGGRSLAELPLLIPEGIQIVEGDGAPPPPEPGDVVCAVTWEELD